VSEAGGITNKQNHQASRQGVKPWEHYLILQLAKKVRKQLSHGYPARLCIRPKSPDERHMVKAYILEDRSCDENSSEFEWSCAEVVLQNNAWKE